MKKIAIIINGKLSEYNAPSFGLAVDLYQNYDLVLNFDGTQIPQKEYTESQKPQELHKEFIAEGVGKPSETGYKTDEEFPDSFPVSDVKEINDLLQKIRKDLYVITKVPEHDHFAVTSKFNPLILKTKEYQISCIQEAVTELVNIEKSQASQKEILIIKSPVCEFMKEKSTFHIKESVMFEDHIKVEAK